MAHDMNLKPGDILLERDAGGFTARIGGHRHTHSAATEIVALQGLLARLAREKVDRNQQINAAMAAAGIADFDRKPFWSKVWASLRIGDVVKG